MTAINHAASTPLARSPMRLVCTALFWLLLLLRPFVNVVGFVVTRVAFVGFVVSLLVVLWRPSIPLSFLGMGLAGIFVPMLMALAISLLKPKDL